MCFHFVFTGRRLLILVSDGDRRRSFVDGAIVRVTNLLKSHLVAEQSVYLFLALEDTITVRIIC